MDVAKQLEHCCNQIESHKITTRKQGCDDLNELLRSRKVIEFIGKSNADWWDRILCSIQQCLAKDHEKKLEDNRRKGSSVLNTAHPSTDLFALFIRISTKESGAQLNFREIFTFIIDALVDDNKKHFHQAFFNILSQFFLSNSKLRSCLRKSDWERLYLLLKSLNERKLCSDPEQLKCFSLIIKWGPLNKLPVYLLRDEFPFIVKLCGFIRVTSKPQQEALVELICDFCKHISKDNRMTCCKLGEEVFPNLKELYESIANEDNMKANLMEFFLVQVSNHHPHGVPGDHKSAYASSRESWGNCLADMYYMLADEIDRSLGQTVRNQSIFVCKNNIEVLDQTLVTLFVAVSRQLFRNDEIEPDEERPAKRVRFEFTVANLIEKIKSSKAWPWLNLTYALIGTHPDMIAEGDFDALLNLLLQLQVDCKNTNLLDHIYIALLVLLKIDLSRSRDIWTNIANATLRLMVKHNNEYVHRFVQELILKKYITSHEGFLQYYKSGTLSVSEDNLKTLRVAFEIFTYLQHDCGIKKEIICWILTNNTKQFCYSYVAEILVYLVLKQWPSNSAESAVEMETKNRFQDIEDTHMITTLENLITACPKLRAQRSRDSFHADQNLLSHLCDLLLNLTNDLEVERQRNDLLNVTVLLFNVTSFLLHFGIINTECSLLGFFEICTKNLLNNLDLKLEKYHERRTEKVTNFVRTLNMLFNMKVCDFLSRKLREFVPEKLIKDLFLGLNVEYEEASREPVKNFKRNTIQTLVSYGCLSDSGNLLPNQQRALQALLDTEYECDSDDDYELVLTLLNSLKICGLQCLSEENFRCIYVIFRKIFEVRYNCHDTVVAVLGLFCDIYPFVTDSLKCHFVELLFPFYCKRSDYGPAVSVSLLRCMSLIFELDPSCAYSKWANEEIVMKIPEFLTDEYQEVRFSAIKAIVNFFEISTKTGFLEQYHRQEIMFAKVSEMSVQVFQIEGGLSEERIIDETVARSACILHTFASIMVASHLWVEEAVFALLRIACDENLDLRRLEAILGMVAQKLGYPSRLAFLEKYVVGLVNRWKPYSFDAIPFAVFDADSLIGFYANHWSLLAHVFVENGGDGLKEVASNLGKSPQRLIEETCPRLFSYCISQEVSDLSSLPKNKIYRSLADTIGVERTREIVRDNIEEVVLFLCEFVSDEASFRDSFDKNIIFPKANDVRITVDEFSRCLQFIKNTIYDENSVMQQLVEKNPEKTHSILLQFGVRIDKSTAPEEKLRYFHLYSIFCDLCLDAVVAIPSLQTYLIRELTHRLLHYIRDYRKQVELSESSCKFFKKVLRKILPNLAEVVRNFFLVIVSRLKTVALEDCPISDLCVDMLELLIVDRRDCFRNEIEKLDSIPDGLKFEKIHSVHCSIKYGGRRVTLDDEIKQFLDFGRNIESLDECEHSLTHLRTLLSDNKEELRTLCLNLRKTRGFSADCENSDLHKLICLLVTLSPVSSEAVRCLGEIGPSDLNTLILRPEKAVAETRWTPPELFLGYVSSLLSKYIVDSDVRVVKSASAALFQVLSVKEGRKILQPNIDLSLLGDINPDYLTPFCSVALRKTLNFNVNIDLFMSTIQSAELWVRQDGYKSWVTQLVCAILSSFKESHLCLALIDVCKIKVEFCEQILPLLIYLILDLNISAINSVISAQITAFFNNHWSTSTDPRPHSTITSDKSALQTMLNVVHFVRLQQNLRQREIKNLNFDYLKMAKAAHFCAAHFTALLYAELWCREQLTDDRALSTSSYTKLDLVFEKVDAVTGNAFQNILRQAYKAVGEVDALSGCGTAHLLNPSSRVEHYKELGRWDFVSHRYDLECTRGGSKHELIESLKNANFYQLPLVCSEEPDYESLWRLSRWDYKRNDLSQSYDKCKFYAFKALFDNDEFSFAKVMDSGRLCVVRQFESNMESIKNFYETFSKLQSLKEMEDFAECLRDGRINELLEKWTVQDEIISNDYQYVEPIHAQRIVLLTDLLVNKRLDNNLRETVMDTIISYARHARIEGQSRVAFRILESLRHLQSSNDISAKMQIEEAQLCWSIDDDVTAKCLLKQLCSNENVNPRLHAMALKMMGTWMAESSSESRQTIIDSYFQKSINILRKEMNKTQEDERSILDTFDRLAKFADREYQEVMTHIKSDVFQKKKRNIVKAQQAVSSVNLTRAPKDLKKAVTIKQKQSCIDQIEITNIETDKDNMLQLALKYYLLNLIGSDDHNMTIFRLFSLLLENKDNEKVATMLRRDLLKIPSYKFVHILPQMTPHMASTSELFCQSVRDVVERCANDHPHHTLPLILALALSKKDRDYTESKTAVNDSRTQNAKAMLKKLKKERNLCELIEKMEFLSDAVIQLAYFNNDGCEDEKFKVPSSCKIRKIRNYDDVLLPTYTLPVNKSRNYERVVGITRFSDVVHNVGGINAPKRITCTGTDGVTRSQLIKGQDDLRQDAVMQQVFTIMNNLLNVNKQTKNLLIRTYKIVPLSMRSGILEWVENTMPIGEYLTGEKGDGGAHAKFRPMDKIPSKCRVEFRNSSNKSNEERLRVFNKICQNIRPVFHKFFEAHFPQPTVWYEKRRAYTHSVATSSMCGYILGIGDRHVNNILIDKTTAEVVHIDFGIAFEQGRVLPTPETVPFRLTRDIVDGMGVSGVEGVFRRSCEKTVEVLRMHYQTIITILEVLLYDPLYDWTVSTAEANKRQKVEEDESILNVSKDGNSDENDSSKDVNVTAERALLRLRTKLLGTENGKSTSVEHQVGTLIQQAVDPSNLSRLFHGWQPYL